MAELRRFYQPVAVNGTLAVSGAITNTSAVLTTPVIDGVTYSARNNRQVITEVVALSGAAIHAGVVAAWVAPAAALVQRVMCDVTTAATGAATLDVGYTATSASTASDTFLDGIDVNAAVALFDSMNYALDSGANAKAQKAASGKWITVKEASGDTTGLVGNLYIQYVLA
jgi:hypothetical protein